MASPSTMGLGQALLDKGLRRLTTSTTPKTKAYSPATDYGYAQNHQNQERKKAAAAAKGDYVPVYVAVGMIALSAGFGLHTTWLQLRTSPTVRVKKQRRETLPEVVEPEHVAEEAEKNLKGSFFRKVATFRISSLTSVSCLILSATMLSPILLKLKLSNPLELILLNSDPNFQPCNIFSYNSSELVCA